MVVIKFMNIHTILCLLTGLIQLHSFIVSFPLVCRQVNNSELFLKCTMIFNLSLDRKYSSNNKFKWAIFMNVSIKIDTFHPLNCKRKFLFTHIYLSAYK